jgi:uncharacterized protein (TIGR01777 family)
MSTARSPQTWLVTGASGLVGTALCDHLLAQGHEVRVLSRSRAFQLAGATSFVWDVAGKVFPKAVLNNVDHVVHLAGANVGQRWTAAHKANILTSRTEGTALLANALAQAGFSGTFMQASAIGLYGECHHAGESTLKGDGFLSDVTAAWESAAKDLLPEGVRHVTMRIGLVLSDQGGTLDKLLPIYRLGLGAPLGSGQQWMSWIHLDDVVRFVVHAASDPHVVGPHNLVAPEPVTNQAFSEALARTLSRPHFAPAVPAFALKLALGEMASLLLTSQHVVPENLNRLGFTWTAGHLDDALERCVKG